MSSDDTARAAAAPIPTVVDAKAEHRARWLARSVAGEGLGTFILVFFGVGVVNAAVVTGAQIGLWQVAVVWAIGVSLGIYASAALSRSALRRSALVKSVPSHWALRSVAFARRAPRRSAA